MKRDNAPVTISSANASSPALPSTELAVRTSINGDARRLRDFASAAGFLAATLDDAVGPAADLPLAAAAGAVTASALASRRAWAFRVLAEIFPNRGPRSPPSSTRAL